MKACSAPSVHIIAEDREAVTELTTAALKSPGQWSHLVSRLRQERKDAEAKARLAAELAGQGVPVIEARWGYLSGAAEYLDHLRIEAAEHAGCPGHAAVIIEGDEDEGEAWLVAYLCTDAVEHGHVKARAASGGGGGSSGPTGSSGSGGAMTDEQKEQRRTVIANLSARGIAVSSASSAMGSLVSKHR